MEIIIIGFIGTLWFLFCIVVGCIIGHAVSSALGV